MYKCYYSAEVCIYINQKNLAHHMPFRDDTPHHYESIYLKGRWESTTINSNFDSWREEVFYFAALVRKAGVKSGGVLKKVKRDD